MTVRLKEYDLKAGDVRQIKIIDIAAPIRVLKVGGTFSYEVLMGDVVIEGPVTPLNSGVLTPTDGAWGSEIRITCTADGQLKVLHVG